MIVVDASVLVNALTDDGPVGDTARAHLSADPHWAAPEHLVVETYAAVRGRWLGRHIDQQRALEALSAVADVAIDTVPVRALLSRLWELRANVTGSDAAYLAVAEAFGCPLVTADARLLGVPGVTCEVRLATPPDPTATPR